MLFIDANAYLEFFASSQGALQKLLPVLVELKDEIFITRQVVSEVERNKLNIAGKSLQSHLENFKPPSVHLPEHLEPRNAGRISVWNEKATKFNSTGKQIRIELEELISGILASIRSSSDNTSRALAEVFSSPKDPTEPVLSRARLRRELGNPPGKIDDPLGDQLSWEMILDSLTVGESVWLITRDFDYAIDVKGHRYLNSYLQRELDAKIGRPVDCFVFDKIADGLADYSKHRKKAVKTIPSREVLRAIAHQEDVLRLGEGGSVGWSGPTSCYICGSSKGFAGPFPRPSRFGSWSYQWLCTACGQSNDFGEPFDD